MPGGLAGCVGGVASFVYWLTRSREAAKPQRKIQKQKANHEEKKNMKAN